MRRFSHIIFAFMGCITHFYAQSKINIVTLGDSNGIYVDSRKMELNAVSIGTLLGKPSRITQISYYDIVYTRSTEGYKGYKAEKGNLIQKFYWIYDSLGLIFSSKDATLDSGDFVNLIFFFDHHREATWDTLCRYTPAKSYSGNLLINGELINTDSIGLPSAAGKKDITTNLFKATFASEGWYDKTVTRIVSKNSYPYLQLYLNNWKEKRLANIVIWSL